MERRINEANYLAICAFKSGAREHAVSEGLLAGDSRQVFSGIGINFKRALTDCVLLGIILNENGLFRLTRFGKTFVLLNPEEKFETTEAQMRLIRGNFGYLPMVLGAGANAKESRSGKGLQEALLRSGSFSHVMKDPQPFDFNAKSAMDEEELEKHLAENRIHGKKAEEFVVEYEKKRLIVTGYSKEAERVLRVGGKNVNLGYDVESFDGASEKPNRLIEVKSTTSQFLRFFWTARERRVAETEGDRYFIYFVWLNEDGTIADEEPEIIQNPAKSVLEHPERYVITTGTIVVKQK